MIRTAQIQDIPTVVQLIHASIRSCILDHQRRESDIQICLENITQTNILGAVVDKVKYPSNPTVFRAVVLDSHS